MPMKLDGFNFDRGIDRIIHNEQLDSPLPTSSHNLAPSDISSRPELDKLLSLPNLHDYLADALKPDIENKAILSPQGFQQALEGALTALRSHAEQAAPDSAEGKALNKAARVLGEEANLRDLLNMYRSVLYQG